jgi:hypothetical protein
MVIHADAQGRADSAYHTLVRHINSLIPVVLVSRVDGYEFNVSLNQLRGKAWVLVDFIEMGWQWDMQEGIVWGKNRYKFDFLSGEEWAKLEDFIIENPPMLSFIRELLKKDVTDTVKPIEYPCVVEKWAVDSKKDFNNRQINVFQYWGRSNECRLRIHGEIWLHAFKKGFQPCDNLHYLQGYAKEERGEKWITLWIPHWARVDVSNLMAINSVSKLSLSWPGAGFKCFRTAEAPTNSVMVMHKNDFAWSFDWDKNNCILVEPGKEIEGIEEALANPNLYEIYLKGVATADKYRLQNYTNHIEWEIKNRIEQ